MTSTPTPKAIEPNDALPASADERLAEAYKQPVGWVEQSDTHRERRRHNGFRTGSTHPTH